MVCLALVWVLWGSVYLAIRLVVDDVDPFQAMAQRFALATMILAALALALRGPSGLRVTRRELGGLVVTGVLLLGLGNGFQALAQERGLPSGVAALVVATVPAWAVLLRWGTGDRPVPMTLVGVVVGLSGLVALVVLGSRGGGQMPPGGVALCLVASVSWTVGSFLQGRLTLPTDVLVIATYQQFVAAGCSLLLAITSRERFSVAYSARGWFGLAYLVIACSIVAYLAFAWLLSNVPLSLTVTHAYVNPMVAVLLGWLVLGESIGLAVLVGGGVVVGAVVLIVTAERGSRGRSEPVRARGHLSPKGE